MKKLFISFLALSGIALLMFSSCKKDGTQTTATLGTAGALSASTTAPALSLEAAANTAVTFTMPETAVSGYTTPVTYSLQFAKKGNNFSKPYEMTATSGVNDVTVAALNAALHGLTLPDGVSTQIEVRSKSSMAVNVDGAYSNVITLTVTPYSETAYIYVPGAYQNWDPTAPEVGALASPSNNGIYDGIIEFPEGKLEFKITPAKSWDISYGGANGKLSTSGGNLSVPSAGTYAIHVDMRDKSNSTYTLTKQ